MKNYKRGQRINLYLSKDVSDEFLKWLGMQSNLSSFFIYAAIELYRKVGMVDVATVMPAKLDYNLEQPRQQTVANSNSPQQDKNKKSEQTNDAWDGLDDLDDIFA